MCHAFYVRLAATGTFVVLTLGPLALPTRADVGTKAPGLVLQCHTQRSLVNGQWIDMQACRRAAPTLP